MKARIVRFRRRVGRVVYSWKRRVEWFLGAKKLAKSYAALLELLVFQHHSLLLRTSRF